MFGQIIRATLGGGKNNGLVHRDIAQQMIEQAQFVAGIICIQKCLCDVGMTI